MGLFSVESHSFCHQLPWLQERVRMETVVLSKISRLRSGLKICVCQATRTCDENLLQLRDGVFKKIGLFDSFSLAAQGDTGWKHPGTLVAIVILSLSLPTSALALEVGPAVHVESRKLSSIGQDLKDCQLILDAPCIGKEKSSRLARVNETNHPVQLASMSAATISPAISTGSVNSNIVHTTGTAVFQQTVPVLHPVVISSSSRILARILQHFGGGGIAGAIGAVIVYPLDTIKTRMQAQSTKDGERPHYKDEIDCFRKLVADEGMGSLYSGLLPQLVGIAPEKAMKLTVNDFLLELLEHMMPGAGVWALELIAGGGGGFSQVVFTNPMEIVKVRLQTQSRDSKEKGFWDVIKELGFQGLYYGAGVTMARDIPSSGLFFACYAVLKQLYPEQSFADAFLAAIPATILSNPMDVVKTRLQMELPPGEVPHENALACFKSVWKREGPKALFKGSLARVLRTSPQFGITLLVYNLICGGS